VKTDHWFYGLFQSAPDLITLLLPAVAAGSEVVASLGPDAPGDALYRFEAPELKAVSHRLDGVLWPRQGKAGTLQHPVVLLEVQMHGDPGFQRRLAAQCFRFLQLHPQVQHLAVVVLLPHRRLNLGPAQLPMPLQGFLAQVQWLSLEELGRQPHLDPLLNLLTLPVRPVAELGVATRQILDLRPDLLSAVLPMLFERYPTLTPEEIMVIAGIPTEDLLHTRAAQMLVEQGEARGRAAEAIAVTQRQLHRRCGTLSEATEARIRELPLDQLEALAEALLDFSGPDDLAAWLAGRSG
jgi:predicted transposase YdaD